MSCLELLAVVVVVFAPLEDSHGKSTSANDMNMHIYIYILSPHSAHTTQAHTYIHTYIQYSSNVMSHSHTHLAIDC